MTAKSKTKFQKIILPPKGCRWDFRVSSILSILYHILLCFTIAKKYARIDTVYFDGDYGEMVSQRSVEARSRDRNPLVPQITKTSAVSGGFCG